MYACSLDLEIVPFTICVTDRVQKLKEARTQATKEIEEYRKFKEEEFKAFEASVRRTTIVYAAVPDASYSMLAPLRPRKQPSIKTRTSNAQR